MENILQSMIQNRNVTRSVLAKENQISLMTVKHIVDSLLEAGIIKEKESVSGDVGRNPKTLEISERYGNVVCINLTSREEIRFLIYDIYRNLITERSVARREGSTYEKELRVAASEIRKELLRTGGDLVGMAVSVPGAYDESQDLVNYDLIPELKGLHVRSLFENMFEIKNIRVLHDVYAAARAEYDCLTPKSESQFYFYCGYGVGGFFIHQDTAVTGSQRMAGEVGKMILAYDKKRKKTETLEERLSVPGIMKRIREGFPDMEFEAALDAYEQGEITIREIFDDALDTIARVLYNLIWVYNPTRIVIDSCYKKYGSLIKEHAERFFKEFQNSDISVRVQFTEAQYDEYHMMRGCMNLVLKKWIEQAVMFSAC